ncbi:hypothetical protein EC845_1181 [Comamonas sp. BIGb0124]|nr:hypothetical protein EC845_1181 [Comamonas sp. BIGb0124]
MAFRLRITGTVISCECRYGTTGRPVLCIEIQAADDQVVKALHHYPDSSNASGHAARSMASRMRKQRVEIEAVNPRFRSKRLDCEATFIHLPDTPASLRKDLQ